MRKICYLVIADNRGSMVRLPIKGVDLSELSVKTPKPQRQRYGGKGEGDTVNRMMIQSMNELAQLYVIRNRYDEPEDLFAEEIEIGDSQLPGKDHTHT